MSPVRSGKTEPLALSRHASDLRPGAKGAMGLRDPAGREIRQQVAEESREYEQQVRVLMRRQRRLSLTAAGLLFLVVGAFTAATLIDPAFMSRPVWHGFSPAILFAAVLIYPLTWVIALLYTVRANHLDEIE